MKSNSLLDCPPHDYKKFLTCIVDAYDSMIIRGYPKARFAIININLLHMIALCLRDKRRVLDVGCGFGLFGCYFSALFPNISYYGVDYNSNRIDMANRAASRLGLKNATFIKGDAKDLKLGCQFDAVIMIDLLHHINDDEKVNFWTHALTT